MQARQRKIIEPPTHVLARMRLGSVLHGKWRLDALLGIGGMATVYAATHRNGSRAAVKILHNTLATDADIARRFVREGLAANAVGHEGAVKVIDDDVAEDGSVFLVTELLEGETLEERRARLGGVLTVPEVLSAIDPVLDVLAAAHAKGIVHRDLKPENLFFTHAATIKVLDFGIARLLDLPAGEAITRTGVTLGTPAFMAPEQARGISEEVDARTDIWAVGATMFTLLTGRDVHVAATLPALILRATTQRAPKLASILPAVSTAVASVVDRALEFDRRNRWPSAHEDGQEVAPGSPRGTTTAGWRRQSPATGQPHAPSRAAAFVARVRALLRWRS